MHPVECIPTLYVKGKRQRNIELAVIEALGVEQGGRSMINPAWTTQHLDFERCQQNRKLSAFTLLYLFPNEIYPDLCPEDMLSPPPFAPMGAYGNLWEDEGAAVPRHGQLAIERVQCV